jgi:hypothetical protein
LRNTTSSRVEYLRNRSWILNPDGCGFRHALARSLASIDEYLQVRFELDAAPQEHIAMVAAGVGCSIVPASALAQSPKHLPSIQQLTVSGFHSMLAVSVVWSERCRPLPGTHEALAAIFEPPALGHEDRYVIRGILAHQPFHDSSGQGRRTTRARAFEVIDGGEGGFGPSPLTR